MASQAIKISEDVLRVLSAAEFDGPRMRLTGQLDRKLYVDTNKVLEAAGGKWNRSAKAHVFDGEAFAAMDAIILTGEFTRTKQDFGQFDSPEEVVGRVIQLADIDAGMAVLEPSAGIGNIASAAKRCGAHVTCWEIDAKRAESLSGIAASLNVGDFLLATVPSSFKFDRVVMNPPFARQDDIRHVLHAAKFLKPGGRLVSVMSAGVLFRDNRLTTDFRSFVEDRDGSFERLPENAFKESGTAVNACIVTFCAGAAS